MLDALALLGICCVSHDIPFSKVGEQVSTQLLWERCKTWLETRQEKSITGCQIKGWIE